MSKLIEFNPEDVKRGLLRQMESPYWGCERKKTTVSVLDVGDYSIFIKKNLEDAKGLLIKTKSSEWYEAKEIMSSPSGSVLYFDGQVGEIFKKGCIYPVVVFSPYVFTYKKLMQAAEELYKTGHIETIGYGQAKILSP